ncbi:hypothetical protein [Bacillus alveayuensis]|jgi:hypothetical protein|uniref:hypothetical protein n=1 Tax=Aeribacillus alveayuensis TaxID=279215 RepID=UPI0005CCA23F|nr:hypothetical protein [Bacillus alveayuensis]
MRDVLILPFSQEERLVIASDNSGAVGEKEHDLVKVDYETVAYFSLRVAMMECMAVGAKPVAIVIQNFVGEGEWKRFKKGAHQLFQELQIDPIPITGSTESNFSVMQSAIGFIVIGRLHVSKKKFGITLKQAKYAVIGEPLVGHEVLEKREKVAPLSLFKSLVNHPKIYEIVPIGSKGIYYELEQLLKNNHIQIGNVSSPLDIDKSAGPATCFLISYDLKGEREIRDLSGEYFHPIEINLFY